MIIDIRTERFPWSYSHRTLAEVEETERLNALKELSVSQRKRLSELLARKCIANHE
jgi:hypothetical protein